MNTWRLFGDKFFCSATHADYAVVTAKHRDSEKVALFVVPAWLGNNKEKEIRNSYTINRIKWKALQHPETGHAPENHGILGLQ